jgi:hypothetical protein
MTTATAQATPMMLPPSPTPKATPRSLLPPPPPPPVAGPAVDVADAATPGASLTVTGVRDADVDVVLVVLVVLVVEVVVLDVVDDVVEVKATVAVLFNANCTVPSLQHPEPQQ